MKINLANPDKIPLCFIGKYLFTYENPFYIVDIETLTNEEKKQFIFVLNRGILKLENKEDIKLLLPKQEKPKLEEVAKPSFRIQKDNEMLKKLLNKSSISIKKEAVSLRLSQIRRILEIESQNKNRKTLIKFFNELISKHQKEVSNKLGKDNLDTQLPDIETNETLLPKVEDSEIKECTVVIP